MGRLASLLQLCFTSTASHLQQACHSPLQLGHGLIWSLLMLSVHRSQRCSFLGFTKRVVDFLQLGHGFIWSLLMLSVHRSQRCSFLGFTKHVRPFTVGPWSRGESVDVQSTQLMGVAFCFTCGRRDEPSPLLVGLVTQQAMFMQRKESTHQHLQLRNWTMVLTFSLLTLCTGNTVGASQYSVKSCQRTCLH